jgi:hypothetical protein
MRTLVLPALVALLAGCREEMPYEGAFEQPSATAVVQPEVGGPFEEPVGYVANAADGQIIPLALKQGRFLTDDPTASFVRGAPLATGEQRRLTSLATWAPDETRVDVLAGDAAFGRLVRVTHVSSVGDGGDPIEPEATFEEPVFVDADDSGDSPTISDVEVRTGWTTAETWSISFDGDHWWVEGSRSGRQETPVSPGERFVGDDRRLSFRIDGDATTGDRFEIVTDVRDEAGNPGVIEYDIGGIPLALATSPDQSVLAVVVHDRETDAPGLRWFDPLAGALTDGPVLADGARPSRLSWSPDGSLFVADLSGTAWEIAPDGTVTAHALGWPALDVAPMISDDRRLLYVARADATEIWVLDLDSAAFVDVNPWIEGVQPLDVRSPVLGIEPMPLEWRWPEQDDDGVNLYGRSVGIALANGRIVFAEEETGCLVNDGLGPRAEQRTDYDEFSDYEDSFDSAYGAFLEENGLGDRHVQVNPCAGVAAPETWTLRFDRVAQGWRVEGAISGEQAGLAYEDQRYVSDDGAVSFTIRSGTQPSEDGWTIRFNVLEGFLLAEGDNDRDGTREAPIDMPTDPVFFSYRVGPQDNGWDPVDERSFLLVASTTGERVGRIEPPAGDVEVDWQ